MGNLRSREYGVLDEREVWSRLSVDGEVWGGGWRGGEGELGGRG